MNKIPLNEDFTYYLQELHTGMYLTIIFDKEDICYEVRIDLDKNESKHLTIEPPGKSVRINKKTTFEEIVSIVETLQIEWVFDPKKTYYQTTCILLKSGTRLYYAFGEKSANDYGVFSINSIKEDHPYMNIKRKNEFGSPPVIELEDFEKENGIQLPSDYKAFLLESNGGQPVPDRNPQPNTNVAYILGMHNGPLYASLYKHIDIFQHRLPFSTFPTATDYFGNLFLLTVHPESYGQIYFWDHEGEPEIQDGHYIDNCSFVAYSFSDFLNNLTN